MMYHMKNIIRYEDEIILPTCMYRIKNPNESLMVDDINIQQQVMKFLKSNENMTELELRQDQLLKKLDTLYERIKTISSQCTHVSPSPRERQKKEVQSAISTPDEIVFALSPDCLPYYVSFLLKVGNIPVNLSWHIHSSVPNEKVAKIQAFMKKLVPNKSTSSVNLRLIFKCVSADAELKLSPVAVPIVGNVNILRYLGIVYPSAMFYDQDDYQMESLLDICHLLERTPEKNKDSLVVKLFAQHKDWIYNNQFSIVDVAAYNVIKQWQNKGKSVPKTWFEKCEKMFV